MALGTSRERHTRLWEPGAGEVVWTARAPDELYAVFRPWAGVSTTSLVRIESGAVTHRRDLGFVAAPALALADARVLVGTKGGPLPVVSLQEFAVEDLAPSPATTIVPLHVTHDITVRALWPLPGGGVVVGLDESWRGPELLHSPHGPSRDEPAHHQVGALYVWSPTARHVGPRFELGQGDAGSGAVVGGRFVHFHGGHTLGIRVRRFTVRP